VRWLFLIGSAVALTALAGSPRAQALAPLAVVLCGAVIHAVCLRGGARRPEIGFLLADTLLIAVTVSAVRPEELALTVSLCVTVILAVLLADRWRAVPIYLVLVALYALVLVDGPVALEQQVPWLGPRLGLLFATAIYFSILAERLVAPAGEGSRPEREQLRVLLEITDTINRSLELRRVMTEVVRRVGRIVDAQSCSILLLDPGHQQAFVVASDERPDVDMLEVQLDRYPEIRKALETREPVVIDDVEQDPLVAPVREILLDKGYRSVVVLPLVFGPAVLGALFLRATRERPFGDAELQFCRVVAGASANSLKNALLFREARLESERHRETSEKLRRILDGTPDLIVATDREGRIVEFNRGAERICSVGPAEAIGKPLEEVLGPLESKPALDGVASGDGARRSEGVLRREGREPVELSLVTAPLRGPDGAKTGEVHLGRDVTHLRRVERSLAQAERLSSLGEVVAGVAHELNNPLSGVIGYAELIRLADRDPARIRDLDRILECARRCQRIVLNLLSFARRHHPEKKVQDLNDCVRKVLELKDYHLRASQVETVLELAPDLPPTSFDFHQLEQVILNLLNNAEQAIRSARRPGRILLRTGVRDGWVELEVEDDGPGVPEAARGRVFDPFFTTKDVGEGTGLGLSVSYGIVQEHGGSIELRSPASLGGARFRLRLPLVAGPRESSARERGAEEAREPGPLRGRRILVAEDEPLVLELMARILRAEGAEVVPACDGLEAWRHLSESDFDLVVVDLRMPNLDGQGLYERVAEERPELIRRFVFATGDTVRRETAEFLERAPNRILTKPLQLETVRRVLESALPRS
jgi:PAS domain S-box-containing protein